MGYKIVCFNCRKAFNNNLGYRHKFGRCQECGGEYVYYNHKFRPPKRTKLKEWQVIKFLYQQGFHFQHIRESYIKTKQGGYDVYAEYPTDLRSAKVFVNKYKSQSINFALPK